MALAGLLLIGVLPLFTKSMSNNVEGNQLTEVTNRARLHLEELMAMPIDAEELTVPDGEDRAGDRRAVLAHRASGGSRRPLPGVDAEPLFTRTTRVRQFNMSAVSNIDLEFEERRGAAGRHAGDARCEIKEIVVRVNTGRPTFLSLMGRQKAVTLRVLKSV